MGAWGTGPFDSDAALDYLAELADQYADQDSHLRVVPGSVAHQPVAAEVRETLEAVTRPAADDEYRHGTCDRAYAAAGLVAAAAGDVRPLSGTRLGQLTVPVVDLDDTSPLGLGAHCGHAALLTPTLAHDLTPVAVAAVEALAKEDTWLSAWRDRTHMEQQVERLRRALTTPADPQLPTD